MNVRYLLLAFLGLSSMQLLAQSQNSPGPKVSFPSPQAAQLGKFGGYEINHSTGSPNIAIPLYTLTEGSISIPLSLTYSYAGCRPTDQPGWVGLGWSFQPGGVITRTIKGVADEKQYEGYLDRKDKIFNFVQKYSMAGSSVTITPADHLDLIPGEIYDTQPDQFSFQFNGYSGQFVFNQEGVPTLLANNDPKLRFSYETKTDDLHGNSDRIISKWTITVEEGTKYEFESCEYTGSNQTINNFKPTAWYISRITSITGDIVEFDYTAPQPYLNSRRPQSSIFQTFNTSSMEGINPTTFAENYTEERYLTAIRSNNWKAEFISEANPSSNYSNGKRLVAFDIYNPKSIKLTGFVFKYTDPSSTKLTLLEVNQSDQPPYIFNYAGIVSTLTLKGSLFSVDYWGFYNGQDNISLIPEFQSPDLEPRLEETKLGALTQITYPTKGYTTFDYELNDYSYVQQQLTPKSKYIFTPYRFSFGKNEHGVVELNQTPFLTVTDSVSVFVKITNNSQNPASCSYTGYFEAYRLPAGTYSAYDLLRKSSSYPCNQPEAMQMSGYKVIMDVKVRTELAKNTSFYGGIRIKSITDYPVTGVTKTRSFYYENEDNVKLSSGVIKAEPIHMIGINLSYLIPHNTNDVYTRVYRSSSFNPMGLFPVRYSRVREVTNTYEIIRTFTDYKSQTDYMGRLSYLTIKEDYKPLSAVTLSTVMPLGDMEVFDYMRFLPKQVQVKNLAGTLMSVTDYTYSSSLGNSVYGVYQDYLFTVKVITTENPTIPFRIHPINYYKLYQIITGFSMKSKETTTMYNSN